MAAEPLTVAVLHDALARLEGRIGKRFDDVARRFDDVDRKFEAVDGRFEAIDRRFDEIQSQLLTVVRRLDAVEAQDRIRALEERLTH